MEQGNFTTAYTEPGPPVYELSGWWRRAGAVLLDGLIITIVARVAIAVLGVDFGTVTVDNTRSSGDASFHLSGWGILIYVVASVGILTTVMAYSNGQTPGMMATGIRVVREDGEKITFGFAFYRENVIKGLLFGWFAIFTLYIATLLNYLWPLWDDKNQALHDKICNTRVVLNKHVEPVAPLVATAPMAAAPPGPPPPADPDVYRAPSGFENPVPDDER